MPSWNDIQITVAVIGALLAGYLVICKVVNETVSLRAKMKKNDVALEQQVRENTEHLDKDNRRIAKLEEAQKMTLESVMVLMNHEIDGNSIDKLKSQSKKVEEFLIDQL